MNQHPAQDRLGARGLFAVAVLALAPAFAFAQAAASPAASEDANVTKLEKFVVTGSYIPYAADAPATPITTITAPDIAKTGVGGDLLEVIRKTIPQFTGSGNLGSSNGDIGSGSTGGGSAIALRNTNTLVLINGRRAAFNPIVAAAGFQFVDVNSIPVSAVERIEVLTDGATASEP
jgi:iron complex outermembrane receptor protein